MSTITEPTSTHAPADDESAQRARTRRAIRTRSFAVLSTVSSAGFPHAAGVSYAAVGSTLYVNTERSSRKARNIAANDRVALVIPVRRLPVGPPFTVQLQGRAALLDLDDREIVEHLDGGRLKAVTSHGEMDEPGGCFLRITPTGRVHTYGIGVSALALARDPLHVGARSTDLS